MLLPTLREQVLRANLELVERGLVLYTFGNVSGIARNEGLVVIKPSGVPYESMTAAHLVVTDLEGKIVEGDLRPSSDLPTHLVLYKKFPSIGGVAHTIPNTPPPGRRRDARSLFRHNACRLLPGPVPVSETMKDSEIASDYELNTRLAIVKAFQDLVPGAIPAVLVANHGLFCWGIDAAGAAHNAVILEAVARMAYFTLRINENAEPVGAACMTSAICESTVHALTTGR